MGVTQGGSGWPVSDLGCAWLLHVGHCFPCSPPAEGSLGDLLQPPHSPPVQPLHLPSLLLFYQLEVSRNLAPLLTLGGSERFLNPFLVLRAAHFGARHRLPTERAHWVGRWATGY